MNFLNYVILNQRILDKMWILPQCDVCLRLYLKKQKFYRKQERQKDRQTALQDLSKLGNLGALTGIEIEEEEEEDEVFGESYSDHTRLEESRKSSIEIRLETEQNALIKRMEVSTKAFDIDLQAIIEKKKEMSVNLKHAEVTVLTMYEELQIVRATEVTEDNLKKRVKELRREEMEAEQLVASKESQLIKRTKAVQRANDQLKTIQEMIENELADNKHSEYLIKLFLMRDHKKSKTNEKNEKSVAASTTDDEQVTLPQVDSLKADLKAGVDDLKHPEDIDPDALKLVMEYRGKRDQIEADVRQEEINIVNLTRELSQAKVQRKMQRSLHQEAIKMTQDYSSQKRNKLNEITTVVLLCRDQLKVTTDRLFNQASQPAQPAVSQGPTSMAQSVDYNASTTTPRSNIDKNELQMATEPENETENGLTGIEEEKDDPILIFSEQNLKQLQRRTEELKTERSMQKNKFK